MVRRARPVIQAALCVPFLSVCSVAWSGPPFKLAPGAREQPLNKRVGKVTWEQGQGRCGGPAVRCAPASAESKAGFGAFAQPRLLVTPTRYRIEAWVKAGQGNCRLDLVICDADQGEERARYTVGGQEEATVSSDSKMRDGWRYRARDVTLEEQDGAVRYNLEVSAQGGPVLVDGLKVVDTGSILLHGDFTRIEPNVPAQPAPTTARGTSLGVPWGWRRHYDFAARGREAEGSFGIEKEASGNALVVRKAKGVFTLCVEPLKIPEATRNVVAWTRMVGDPDSRTTAVVRQYGRHGLLREDRAHKVFHAAEETIRTTGGLSLHSDASRILFLLEFPEESGAYQVQSVGLSSPAEATQGIEILSDQVGYDTGEPLRFIVAAPLFPTEGPAACRMIGADGRSYERPLTPLGRAVGQDESDWGRYYFEGIFADPAPGRYTLTAQLGRRSASLDGLTVSPGLRLRETGELAYCFYSVQRCGCAVPGWHGPCHMDDARLPDGTHVDVSGGYHNAGDLMKDMGDNTPISVYAMIHAYEAEQRFFDAVDRDRNGRGDLLDEAIWGADWMRKMVDPKTGRLWINVTNDVDFYGTPEQDTDGVSGTADDRVIGTTESSDQEAFAIAAWAALARHVPDSGYLGAAEKLWAVDEAQILAGYDPRHVFAALELAHSTGRARYRAAGDRVAENLLGLQSTQGWFASRPRGGPEFRIVDEGTIPAALAHYALARPDSPLLPRVKDSLRGYFAWSLRLADNPFGLIRNYTGGEPFYFKDRDGWYGGENSEYCSTAWAAYLASRVFQHEPEFSLRLRVHAANQVHWVLGMNPLELCMFEGKGSSGRIYYHHLYAAIQGHPRGAVPGAIPNGIVREPGNADSPWFDLRSGPGSVPDAESAEPWLPHNAHYLLMLSAMRLPDAR